MCVGVCLCVCVCVCEDKSSLRLIAFPPHPPSQPVAANCHAKNFCILELLNSDAKKVFQIS